MDKIARMGRFYRALRDCDTSFDDPSDPNTELFTRRWRLSSPIMTARMTYQRHDYIRDNPNTPMLPRLCEGDFHTVDIPIHAVIGAYDTPGSEDKAAGWDIAFLQTYVRKDQHPMGSYRTDNVAIGLGQKILGLDTIDSTFHRLISFIAHECGHYVTGIDGTIMDNVVSMDVPDETYSMTPEQMAKNKLYESMCPALDNGVAYQEFYADLFAGMLIGFGNHLINMAAAFRLRKLTPYGKIELANRIRAYSYCANTLFKAEQPPGWSLKIVISKEREKIYSFYSTIPELKPYIILEETP